MCDHKDWAIWTGDAPGYGHCNDCGESICVAVLIDNEKLRILQRLEHLDNAVDFMRQYIDVDGKRNE